MNLLTLLISLLLFPLSGFTAEKSVPQPSIGKPTGYVIIFKNSAETDFKFRDTLHKKFGLKLVHRAESLPADQVVPADAKDLAKPLPELEKLCAEYQKSDAVESCEVTTEKSAPVDCPAAKGTDTNLKKIKAAASTISSKCDLVGAGKLKPSPDNPNLSPLWAQNMVGIDLTKERMKALDGMGAVREVNVGDLDSGFSQKQMTGKTTAELSFPVMGPDPDHGTKVVNLINGKGAYGSGYKVNMTSLVDGYGQSVVQAVDEVLKKPPEILNFEYHTVCSTNGSCATDPKAFNRSLQALTHKTLVVAAAGNYYGKTSAASPDSLRDVVLVGSAHPAGIVSEFSDEDPNVAVLSPSDYHLYSPGLENTSFSGTSGATPLVTGALANAKSILGNFSVWDARVLLKKTATPLVVTSGGNKNGTGLLNAYKLLRVSERLREKGWPKTKVDLKDNSLYDFKKEAAQNVQKADQILKNGKDCESMSAALKLYRESFLLDSGSVETSQKIADILEKSGYKDDAVFYRSRDPINMMATLQSGATKQSSLVSPKEAQRNLKLITGK